MSVEASRVGVVLPGGGALGAYEAGVLHYVLYDVAAALGRDVPLDVLCGTSVGSIGASLLAAYADEPRTRADRLVQQWMSLQLDVLVRAEILGRFVGWCEQRAPYRRLAHRSLFPLGVDSIVRRAIPFDRIGVNRARGLVHAVSASTTHVASGSTVVFVDAPAPTSRLRVDRGMHLNPTRLRAEHLLASSAIPFLFPAVRIEGDLYCEGALRQNVPLAPALHLGANRLLIVTPHYVAPPDRRLARARERAVGGPLFLLGRTLHALLLDRVDDDVDRLAQINRVLALGALRFGTAFDDALNAQSDGSQPLRIVEPLVVRASQSLGMRAAAFVHSERFRASRMVRHLYRRLAEAEGTAEADLVAHLLFDGRFASELISLGREDARAHHDALCAFVEPRLRMIPGASQLRLRS
jgi:NTE family protein